MSSTTPAQRRLLDSGLVVAVFAVTLAVLSHSAGLPGRGPTHDFDLTSVGFAAASAGAVGIWRRFPVTAFALSTAPAIGLAVLGSAVPLLPGPIIALYLLTAHRHAPPTLVIGLFVLRLAVIGVVQGVFPGTALLHSGLAWAVAWFAGETTRLRRAQVEELAARARRTELHVERDRQLAIAEERARLARDLHDSAGHAISLIAVRAGAARLRHQHEDPQRCLIALQTIETVARQTAAEIDQIVGRLRDTPTQRGTGITPPGLALPATDVTPAGLASLDTLLTQHRQAGLTIAVKIVGKPHALPTATDQAAYRILQEALRNAARHGTGTADVEIAYDDTAVSLTVSNPVPAAGPAQTGGGHNLAGGGGHGLTGGGHGLAGGGHGPAGGGGHGLIGGGGHGLAGGGHGPAGGGHGLIGMRERAVLLGGSLHTEQSHGRYWIQAHVPHRSRR